jgi:ketosteroid isomerase-like protein
MRPGRRRREHRVGSKPDPIAGGLMTMTNTHSDTVAAIYEAFGRGDVPFILDQLADDVRFDADWTNNYGQRAGVEHLTPRRGPAQVADFFAVIAGWQVEYFQVLDLIGSGHQVVAEVQAGFTLPNGGRFADDELHLWTFNEAGKATRFRHYVDTAKHIAAAAGVDTTTS